MEPGTEIAAGKWSAPECPFQIEFSTRVLDDIRLAVVDAFFLFPRGGAEIGGILLGRHEGDLISITGYEALDCEHATGPSFTLSLKDQARLTEILAKASRNSADRQPVGWYHSHTRSDIFFSKIDQEIHDRFFPEPWQIALVLKPHTFEPTRGGFFFREGNGSIRGSACYREFVLEPLAMRPTTTGYAGVPRGTLSPATDLPVSLAGKAKGRVPITRELSLDAPSRKQEADQDPVSSEEIALPRFTQPKPEKPWRAATIVACLAVALVAGGVGYQTREDWMPKVTGKLGPLLPKEPDGSLSLSVSDQNGQLNIHWDPNAPAVRNAREATLGITDGNLAPRSIRLDRMHLATGSFDYGRESERVDVALTASEPHGRQIRGQASYLGKLPSQEHGDESGLRKERDALAEKAAQLQKQLDSQAARSRKLEKYLNDIHDQLQNEQRRRMASQSGDPEKKD